MGEPLRDETSDAFERAPRAAPAPPPPAPSRPAPRVAGVALVMFIAGLVVGVLVGTALAGLH